MDIQPIKTKRDYLRALKEIEPLMDAKRGTPEGDRLDVLVTLVEAWEAKHCFPAYPEVDSDPVIGKSGRGGPCDWARRIGSKLKDVPPYAMIRLRG